MINIDKALKNANLSKQDLAKRIGTTRENLWRILNGNPTLENIKKIAKALGVEVWELFAPENNSDSGSINGFVEYKGTIYRIQSVEDLNNLLKLVSQE